MCISAELYWSIFLETIRYSLLDQLIACMTADWKELHTSDELTMIRMAYISRRICNLIIISYAIGATIHATGTLLKYKIDNQTDARVFIAKMELPFEIESTSVYIVILVLQFIHETGGASMAGVVDSVLIILVSQCSFYLLLVNDNEAKIITLLQRKSLKIK